MPQSCRVIIPLSNDAQMLAGNVYYSSPPLNRNAQNRLVNYTHHVSISDRSTGQGLMLRLTLSGKPKPFIKPPTTARHYVVLLKSRQVTWCFISLVDPPALQMCTPVRYCDLVELEMFTRTLWTDLSVLGFIHGQNFRGFDAIFHECRVSLRHFELSSKE